MGYNYSIFLYRQLVLASRYGVKQIGGFIPLLEARIYEHFPSTWPQRNVQYDSDKPLATKWSPANRYGSTFVNQVSWRETLDSLSDSHVEWNPYLGVRDKFPLIKVVSFQGCIRSFDIVEPYHLDRVLRQFGFVQKLPTDPIASKLARRPAKGVNYTLTFDDDMIDSFSRWDDYLSSSLRRGRVASSPWECSHDYLEWY